jgi:antitoxin (DNA-binding transcriptional repressor) of toxin-antitoxin stability system
MLLVYQINQRRTKMRFVSVRELSTKPKEVWQKIKEDDIIITSNGKPIAILSGVTEASLDRELRAIRRGRALLALEEMQKVAEARRLDEWTESNIEAEITAVRKSRRI